MSPPRIRKNFGEWPAADQAAWQSANRDGSLFDDGGGASRWSPVSRRNAEKAYGLYLAFLETNGVLYDGKSPGERFTTSRISDYIKSLSAWKPVSRAGRLRDLYEAVRVMWPKADHETLRVVVRRLQAEARRYPRVSPSLVSPSNLYFAGMGRMVRVREVRYEKRGVQALQFADGLMMSMLAAKPIRRRNLHALEIGRHLFLDGDTYLLSFGSHETKTGQPIRAELPTDLTPWIDEWLEHFRPILVGEDSNEAMWISAHHRKMAASTITARFRTATQDELGVPISPHHVRHALATGVAVSMPDKVTMTPYLLDHRGDGTSRRHYNLATSLSASQRYLETLNGRRDRSRKI